MMKIFVLISLLVSLLTSITAIAQNKAAIDFKPLNAALERAQMCVVTMSRVRGVQINEDENTEWLMTCLDSKKNRVLEKKVVARDNYPQDGTIPKGFGYLELMVEMKNRDFNLQYYGVDFGMIFSKKN